MTPAQQAVWASVYAAVIQALVTGDDTMSWERVRLRARAEANMAVYAFNEENGRARG